MVFFERLRRESATICWQKGNMFSGIKPGFSLGKLWHLISNGVEMVPSKPREDDSSGPGLQTMGFCMGQFRPPCDIYLDGKVSAGGFVGWLQQ